MTILRIDHVGINVLNITAAKAFFLDVGFIVMGEMHMEGKWVGDIIGLKDVSDDIVMMKTPNGQANIELIQFHHPVDENGVQPSQSNLLGLRHICLTVEDVDGLVAALHKKHGSELMGTVFNYKDIYKLCYIRGPEGIILELAEELKKANVFEK